jgi:arsenate reductase (glutaredoxin)
MKTKIYTYAKCSTCRNAIKFLEKKKVEFLEVPIIDTPPSIGELKRMLGYLKENGGTFKNLFNTSGVQYRELGISEKIKSGMTETEALTLLSGNGKLIKRPFVLTPSTGLVGFQEVDWKNLF